MQEGSFAPELLPLRFLLIAASFLMTIPSASGVSISQLYKALEKVKNVYIASFYPRQRWPRTGAVVIEDIYGSKYKNRRPAYLWDSRNGTRKIMSADFGLIETFPLSEQKAAADVGKTMKGSTRDWFLFADFVSGSKECQMDAGVTGDILESPARRH